MTQPSLLNSDSTPVVIQPKSSNMKSIDAEVIRALTPIFIATIGGVIGIVVLFTNQNNSAGLGLASTAIAGAAGLAQPYKDLKAK